MAIAALAAWPAAGCDDDATEGGDDGGVDVVDDVPVDVEPDVPTDVPADVAEDVPADATDTPDAVDPCWEYACGPYGYRLGNVVADLAFTPANTSAGEIAGADESFDFHDLWQRNEAHGGTLRGLLIFVTTGWCPYCAQEAPKLQGLYEELRDQGILLVGLVKQNSAGAPATATYARSYASRYGWTFPTLAGDINENYWPADDVAAGEAGVPLHFFVDLRNMRIYGRFAGATEMKIPRYALQDIAAGPAWGPGGTRVFDFDCGTSGTEVEPNGLSETPENGTGYATGGFTLTGTQCPPGVGDGILIDEDVVNLGTLAAGTVIDVQMTRPAGSGVYPFFHLLRVSGGEVAWQNYGPALVDADAIGRQWVIETAGQHFLAVYDGRTQAPAVYGEGAAVPLADQCCDGGPDYTYSVAIRAFDLAATTDPLPAGSTPATLSATGVGVFPLGVTASTPYAIRMVAADNTMLDPSLVLYDPVGRRVLAFNDDENYSGGNINSLINHTPTADGTVWVVAGYWGSWFRGGAGPAYTIRVE
jgi:thiol-disulfide isomerase/thioredoxin